MITYTLDYNGNVVQSHRVDAGGQLFYTYTYDYTDRMTHLAIDENLFPPVSEMEMLCGYDAGGLRIRRRLCVRATTTACRLPGRGTTRSLAGLDRKESYAPPMIGPSGAFFTEPADAAGRK